MGVGLNVELTFSSQSSSLLPWLLTVVAASSSLSNGAVGHSDFLFIKKPSFDS